ncbi:MAG: hypothetical protein A2496_02100 [Burkholderiales bacterium RIFOXYC12_FULL_60_6]|nr:MAG: hypothetical protein A2496_02100 [Burkholderiales bacterium RIFOXYC12_FULL_60_6]
MSVRFDNTVKASAIYRLHDADPALVDSFRLLVPGVPASAFPQALNFNAGNDNFRSKGFVSERIDLLSELDVVYRNRYGFRVSAAASYDAAYSRSSQATDAMNGQTPYNEFSSYTREAAGRSAEVLDAFAFAGWDIGESRKLNVRLGKHALVYGESLFFGDNGIARAQGPMNVQKLLSSPNAQFKEIIVPVPQVSAQLQVSSTLSLGAYYQFGWEADRMPAGGSYFSGGNNIWGGSTFPELVGTNLLLPGADQKAKDSGQFGLQLKWRNDDTDLGFYAARYHDKAGQFYSKLNVTSPAPGDWYYVFPENITTVGMSASQTLGDTNFAVEASVRNNMPLVNGNIVYPNVMAAPDYAKGRTGHVNFSWLATFGPNALARESVFLGELAWNRVLSSTDPTNHLDATRTRDASAIQFIYTPSYRQVLPGLDIGVPVGLRYALDGNSSITGLGWGPKGTGSATLGLEGTYQGVWQFTLGYTHFIGKAEPFVDYRPLLTGGTPTFTSGNTLADRDFLSFSLRRTF